IEPDHHEDSNLMCLCPGKFHTDYAGRDMASPDAGWTLDTSAFAAGDQLSPVLVFTGALICAGGTALLTDLIVKEKVPSSAPRMPDMDILLMNATYTPSGVNTGMSAPDVDTILGLVPVRSTDWSEIDAETGLATLRNVNLSLKAAS